MALTFDVTTSRGKVRLLIHDTDTATAANQLFTDAEIDAFLSLENQEVYAAAAAACESIASSAARSAIRVRAERIFDIDRRDVPGHFMKLAKTFRARAVEGEPWEINDSVDYHIDRYGRDLGESWGEEV